MTSVAQFLLPFRCSDYHLLLPKEMGYKEPQRTCYACFKEFSSIDFSVDHELFGPPGAPVR